jgi:hypothetical protein
MSIRTIMIPSALLLSSLLAACDEPPARSCVQGRQEACACADGTASVQVCSAGGTYDVCQCQPGGRVTVADAGSEDASTGSASAPGSDASTRAPGAWPDFSDRLHDDGAVPSAVEPPAPAPDAGAPAQAEPTPPVSGACSSSVLSFRPIDVEYSRALDQVVAVGASPNQLVLFDPVHRTSAMLALPLEPAAVSVSPDGRTAAVAHNAYLSIVNLVTGKLVDTIPTTSDAADVVLAGNGYAYVFPRTDQWVDIHSVELSTRTDRGQEDGSIYANTAARLHPGGTSIYGITRGLSPTDIERYDISTGVASSRSDSPYHGDYPMCEAVWFTEGGERLFTGCGTVFRAAPGAQGDMTYAGALGGAAAAGSTPYGSAFRWITHSKARGKVYGVPRGSQSSPFFGDEQVSADEKSVRVYSEEFLALETSLTIPCLTTPVGDQPVYGRFAFASSTGKQLYVLGQLDPKTSAALDWAFAAIDL